jgi:hypothetical protein
MTRASWKSFWAAPVLLVAGLGGLSGCSDPAAGPAPAKPPMSFKPREMADALHAVIAADRNAYTRLVVQRLHQEKQLIACSENWEAESGLPVPAQMLSASSTAVASQGVEFSYKLRSLSPLNPKNAPETALEREGLQFVFQHPGTNFYSEETLGGRHYLTAVYPDRAIAPTCVQCHNRHPKSPRQDFKEGDVLGGLVLRVALEF